MMPFYASECVSVGDVDKDLMSPTYCGIYDLLTTNDFASCLNADSTLGDHFLSMCQYDFCENYLSSSDDTEAVSSACFSDGKWATPPTTPISMLYRY